MTTGLHSTKQQILQYLLKNRQATAQQLAEVVGITPQAVRRHLNELEAEMLIVHSTVQTGMGRPQHAYQLSEKGRDHFPHRYNDFAVSFLEAMVETVGEEKVSQVLQQQWEQKAATYRAKINSPSLQQRLEKLVKLRQLEGYMAELHPLTPESDTKAKVEKFILTEHNCAIHAVAESYPRVCGHELEMFQAIFPDCTVERIQWINNGENRCGYSIQKK